MGGSSNTCNNLSMVDCPACHDLLYLVGSRLYCFPCDKHFTECLCCGGPACHVLDSRKGIWGDLCLQCHEFVEEGFQP